MQNPEIDLVGAMRVGRVASRLDVRAVVVEQIENVMALMFMRPNDPYIDRYMFRHQSAGTHTLVQTEVFGGIPGVVSVNLRFKPLPVTAGMQGIPDVEQVKGGQGGRRVADGRRAVDTLMRRSL